MSQLCLLDSSHICAETDSDISELTPLTADRDKHDVFVIGNKTVLSIEQCDEKLVPIRKAATAIGLKELGKLDRATGQTTNHTSDTETSFPTYPHIILQTADL